MRGWLAVILLALLSACAGSRVSETLPRGAAAYQMMPAASSDQTVATYRISPLDVVDITVFGEPDLSVKAIQVDAAGELSLPLVGNVHAAGSTASELSRKLEGLFGAKYLKDPKVTTTVAKGASQKVAVQGEVAQPGVFELQGPTSLLEALSMAKGELRTAALDQVVVFRNINGQRMGAVFDVRAIREGKADDPQIVGNDMVVVGFSGARRLWRDVVSSASLFNVFRPVIP
ncbi:polysaccharide biosynthesis/export family protein [Sphingomonas sp. URHD0057]|uniref:polysaccharide biosynthesis/export family protein n=1 Tax=Sphingomonas sp. URHD0057 TaxID=1380389 RepID=UPI00048AF759|nr:polysaccharide biosynthesis/export family protein [Sphingomonas sp. URHD0057]